MEPSAQTLQKRGCACCPVVRCGGRNLDRSSTRRLDLIFGVSTFGRAKKALDAAAKLSTPCTLHELRRTCASGMARLGVAPHVVEAVLNHKSGQVRGVAAVYNCYSYAAEKAAALALWGEHVERCAANFIIARPVAAEALPVAHSTEFFETRI